MTPSQQLQIRMSETRQAANQEDTTAEDRTRLLGELTRMEGEYRTARRRRHTADCPGRVELRGSGALPGSVGPALRLKKYSPGWDPSPQPFRAPDGITPVRGLFFWARRSIMTVVIVPKGGQMHTTPEQRERLKLYRRDYRAKQRAMRDTLKAGVHSGITVTMETRDGVSGLYVAAKFNQAQLDALEELARMEHTDAETMVEDMLQEAMLHARRMRDAGGK